MGGSPSPGRLLILAGDPEQARTAAGVASEAGLEPEIAADLTGLLGLLGRGPAAVTLVSLAAPGMEEPLVRRLGGEPRTGGLVLSAPGITLDRALLAEEVGALALLREPLEAEPFAERLRAVVDEGTQVVVPPAGGGDPDRPRLLGSGPAMATVFEGIARVARTPSTVLITGESGTGKEVVAQALHWASDRRARPFVAVNCAAIPEHLLESELFGHERGAFTGAVASRTGRFERAQGGTLFLDEIGDMSLVLQAKILRVLEERRLERVGGERALDLDVRLVAATHQPLRERTREGRFREDLFYRLAVVELALPPLRERGDDLRELTLHFLGIFGERYGRPVQGITEQALERLAAHTWPGNVRELRNVLDRAVLMASDGVVRAGDLRLGAGAPTAAPRSGPEAGAYPVSLSLAEVEAEHIRRVLDSVGGHMGRAAEGLGIHRNTLTRKVQEYGLQPRGEQA
ncbi:MAG: sigma-54 dependent transcriptional regulator [Gemmatimonadota bacterium]